MRAGEAGRQAASIQHTMKTDREHDDLIGPVYTIRTRVTKLLAKVHRPTTSARTLQLLTTYDPTGRKIEVITYNDDDSISRRALFTYDEAGRRTQASFFNPSGSLVRRSVYRHDTERGVVEELDHGPDGRLMRRNVQRYDAEGNQLELATYLADGALLMKMANRIGDLGRVKETVICHGQQAQPHVRVGQDKSGEINAFVEGSIGLSRSEVCGEEGFLAGKVAYEYDDAGDLGGHTVYAPDGTAQDRFVFAEDKEGHVSEMAHYDAAGSLLSKEVIEREVDSYGNWIKETVSSWVAGVRETEPSELEPTEEHYRTITYY